MLKADEPIDREVAKAAYRRLEDLLETIDELSGFEMTAAKLASALDQCRVDMALIKA